MEPDSHGLVAQVLEVIRNVCTMANTVKPECKRLADRFSAIGEGLVGVGLDQNLGVGGKAIDGSGKRKKYPDLHRMLELLRSGEILVSQCSGMGPNFQDKQLESFQEIHRGLDTLRDEFDFENYRDGLARDSETYSGTSTGEKVSSLASSDTDSKGDVDLPTYLRIDPSAIHRGRMIGKGANAEVYEATWLDCGCAVKVFSSKHMNVESISKLQKELDFLIRLRHPYMIQLMGLSVDSRHRCSIVMELMSCSLRELIDSRLKTGNRSVPFDLHEAVSIIKKIALGMAFVHSKGVAHRDLKAANVMVEVHPGSNIDVKIADFGESQFTDPNIAYSTAGTTAWMAPEILPGPSPASEARKPDLKAADVYSFAMLCYEVFTGKKPFSGTLKREQYHDVRSGRLRPELPVGLDGTLKGLIEACWNSKAGERPNFVMICCILNPGRNFDIPDLVTSNLKYDEGIQEVRRFELVPGLKRLLDPVTLVLRALDPVTLVLRLLDPVTPVLRALDNSVLWFHNNVVKDSFAFLVPDYLKLNHVDLSIDRESQQYLDFIIERKRQQLSHLVYQATFLGCEFAVKTEILTSRTARTAPQFENEVFIMMKLRHPHILQLVGISIDSSKGTISMIMERMKSSLKELIRERMESGRKVPFDLREAVLIMTKIALGMAYMHSQQIFHCDLKPGNVMVNKIHGSIDVKISGFGLSIDGGGEDKYHHFENLKAGDIYSFAMICYYIITGHAPFLARREERPELPANLPPDLALLITECWHRDPLRRVQFTDIWFILLSINQKLLSSSS